MILLVPFAAVLMTPALLMALMVAVRLAADLQEREGQRELRALVREHLRNVN
jgi:hypothetical protein